MSIYNGILTSIDEKEMLRYAGLHNGNTVPAQYIKAAQNEMRMLATPMGVYQEYDYDDKNSIILSSPPLPLVGKSIQKHLHGSLKVYVLSVTVGEEVEDRITELFKSGEYTTALLLDAAATTAVEQVADQVNNLLSIAAKKDGLIPTWRFSPGYGDWPVEVQKELAHIIDANSIGVTVTDASMLFPRKSVTAIIGLKTPVDPSTTIATLDSDIPKEAQKGCPSCSQANCLSRKK